MIRFLLALCLPFSAVAFLNHGHMMVAAVAQKFISPEVYSKIMSLIEDPKITKDYAVESSFVGCAAWMDTIKTRTLRFDEWHFMADDIVREGQRCAVNDTGKHVIWALETQIETLANPEESKIKKFLDADFDYDVKSLAIRFLIHLVGDIHQPLHNAGLCSKRFPAGDEGGNLFKVSFGNLKTDLHSFWDALGMQYKEDRFGPGPFNDTFTFSQVKAARINAVNIIKEFPPETFPTLDKNNIFDFSEWEKEGHMLAVTSVYSVNQFTKLSSDYVTMARYILRKQVALGGYRLALILEKVFA